MPRLIPEDPVFATDSERQVWELLRDQLGDHDVLLANVRLTDETKDHEADLVVLMPEFGVLVLEVKGGAVRYEDGWILQAAGQARWIHPVDQARDSKHAVRKYVEQQPTWGRRGRVNWAHGVVTPYSSFPQDFSLPDLPRRALHDRDDLKQLATRVRQNVHDMDVTHRVPDLGDIEAIVEALTGRPHTSYDVEAEALEREARADRLTQEQAAILQVTRLLNRIEVRGGAGSGKTVLALQQAKQLAKGRSDRKPQRVAMLCYSIGLAAYLKREVATWDRRERPAFVGTFHEFGKQWGAPDGDRQDSEFWETTLPSLMRELAGDLPDGKKYDAVIVDEAQDFAESWWTPLLRALRDEETSGVYAYADENQRVFGRYGRPPVSLVPLVLDHNLRNTKQIHEAFGPLAPSRMYSRGGIGPAVRFVAAATEDAVGAADDVVDEMIDEGWDAGSIALITTGHKHPVHDDVAARRGQEGYWKQFWDAGDVFYGHVLGCKGLERRAVVLCINESSRRDRFRERLYVGMSRATDELVVVGDPELIREMGGADVARRLGI